MAGEQTQSRRDAHIARLQAKHPDKQFDDEEAIYGQIGEDYDSYEQELGEYKKREQELGDMFAKDPRSAQFFVDMHQGKSPWASYIRTFGPEMQDMLDDPEVLSQIAQAETDYTERVSKTREYEAEYERNLSESLETLRSFQQQNKLSEEQADEVYAALIGIVRDGVMGKFLPDTLQMVLNGINHDGDVANAGREGEIAGRNARITEKLRKSKQGDGVSALGGTNNGAGGKQDIDIFERASRASARGSYYG